MWLYYIYFRFVTKSDITEYISPDQLLTKFGGTDPWTYCYDPEELKELMGDIWENDPLIVEEDDQYIESSIEDSIKQVRP